MEKNAVPPLQQLSTNNNNKVEKLDTSSSTLKSDSPESPNGKVSAKRKKCLPIKLKKQSDDGTEFMVNISWAFLNCDKNCSIKIYVIK